MERDYDELERLDAYNEMEHLERWQFARPFYAGLAAARKLHTDCRSQCKRAKRCCYLDDRDLPGAEFCQPLRYNCRVRFMPLCLARATDEEAMEDLRREATFFLR